MRILIGLILVGVGFVIVWKTRKFIDTFGSIEWADRNLGGGGTSLLYKTIGLVFIFVGFLAIFNLWNVFLEATLGSVFFPKKSL